MYAVQQNLGINAGIVKMVCECTNHCKTGISKKNGISYKFEYVDKEDIFKNGLECFGYSFTFLIFKRNNPAVFTEDIYNHEKILISFVPFTQLLHFNKISSPYFINMIKSNTPSSKVTLYGFMQLIS